MPNVSIIIHEKGDPEPAIKGVIDPEVLRLDTFVILEGGMVSGEASIAFHAIGQDEKNYVIQSSAALLEGMYAATLGAMERFAQKNR